MRLIDADALWMEIIHTMDYCDDVLEIIEHQKTIEPTHHNASNTLKTLDCVGRQQAIDAVQGIGRLATLPDNDAVVRMSAVEYVLFNLPSAQPERKKGKWIDCNWSIRCSECDYSMPWAVRNFCPNCGADMREVAE